MIGRRGVPEELHDGADHVWRCPVIMKTDPPCVAFTCSRCGAIAVVRDGVAQPDAAIPCKTGDWTQLGGKNA